METTELIEIISRGEDSKHQFKSNISNNQSLAEEIIAFSNTLGGMLIIGVSDDQVVLGLTKEDIQRINLMISDVSSQHIKPAINPNVENIKISDKLIMIVTVPEGISKPYMDKNGSIFVKSGADKRKATSREEIQRMYQSAGLIHGDEIPANGMIISDIDFNYFSDFMKKEYNEIIDDSDSSLPRILENMNLVKNGIFNIAGALLFGKNPQFRLPVFIVKAVSYPGNNIDESNYLDSKDMTGKLSDMYQKSLNFIINNLRNIQKEKGVNSSGDIEIPKIVIEELLVNALIHRDYFISSPIRIFVFKNRIEMLSPGHLPNNLTIDNIKNGNSNIRNPILTSFASKLLPYRGLGNGIRRAIKAYPYIEFEEDRDGNVFKVIIKRKID